MSDVKDPKKQKEGKEVPTKETNIELEDLEIQKPEEVKGGLAATKTSTYMCPW